LTDNEKTVSVDHVARIAVRNPEIVEVGRHYRMTIRTVPELRLPIEPTSDPNGLSQHVLAACGLGNVELPLAPTEA
jgi:hypothetical protein